MELIGLDDNIGVIDPTSIAIEQVAIILKQDPSRWGELVKQLPESTVRELCKQGAIDEYGNLALYGGLALGALILFLVFK